ncbi:hypothetical protein ACPXCP_20295 [Streptomyces sp. DT20]|uniref:hypothetical protein n=1 Tax=Streptomyces sp. DT20 TaxID=3416519 RepID=UPI003CEA36A7
MQFRRLAHVATAAIFTATAINAAATSDHFAAACYTGAAVIWLALAILAEDHR